MGEKSGDGWCERCTSQFFVDFQLGFMIQGVERATSGAGEAARGVGRASLPSTLREWGGGCSAPLLSHFSGLAGCSSATCGCSVWWRDAYFVHIPLLSSYPFAFTFASACKKSLVCYLRPKKRMLRKTLFPSWVSARQGGGPLNHEGGVPNHGGRPIQPRGRATHHRLFQQLSLHH